MRVPGSVVAVGVALLICITGCQTSSSGGSQAAGSDKSAGSGAGNKVLLNVKGNGQHTTQKFTAAGDWDMAYSYDCANFGQKGNFAVLVYGHDSNLSLTNDGPNELGKKGSGVEHEHHGGTYYLNINSECKWHVKVTG